MKAVKLAAWLTITALLSHLQARQVNASAAPEHSLYATHHATCPCRFTIEARHPNVPLDFLVFGAGSDRAHATLSRFVQTPHHAVHHDAPTVFHKLHVPQHMTITLRVRPSNPSQSQPAEGHVRILPTSRESCPVELTPQRPAGRFESIAMMLSTRRSAVSRIEGGRIARQQLANYLVYLETLGDDGQTISCSGTLVNATSFITAASCNVEPGNTRVYARVLQGRPANGDVPTPLGVSAVTPGDGYDRPSTLDHQKPWWDFAIVTLDGALPTSAPFMKVNVNNANPAVGSFARTVGYSVLHLNRPVESNELAELRQVDVPIVSRSDCSASFREVDENMVINYETQVCAGYLSGGCDACQGDGGAPLIQYNEDDEPVLIGVVSKRLVCAREDLPGLYTRTAFYGPNTFRSGIALEKGRTVAQFRDDDVPLAAIIGGSVGGAVFLIVIVIFICCCCSGACSGGRKESVPAKSEEDPYIQSSATAVDPTVDAESTEQSFNTLPSRPKQKGRPPPVILDPMAQLGRATNAANALSAGTPEPTSTPVPTSTGDPALFAVQNYDPYTSTREVGSVPSASAAPPSYPEHWGRPETMDGAA